MTFKEASRLAKKLSKNSCYIVTEVDSSKFDVFSQSTFYDMGFIESQIEQAWEYSECLEF